MRRANLCTAFKSIILFLIGTLSLWPVIVLAQPAPAPIQVADEETMRHTWEDLRNRLRPLDTQNPQAEIIQLTQFINTDAHIYPTLASSVTQVIAQLYATQLKDNDKALAICEYGLQKFGADPRLGLIQEELNILIQAGRNDDANRCFKAHEDEIFQAWGGALGDVLHSYATLTEKLKQPDAWIDALERGIITNPELTDPATVPGFDWLYGALIQALVKQGQPGAALSWAKLRLVVCGCTDDALLTTGRTLAVVWDATDTTGKNPIAFAAALRDPKQPNPLATVKLPILNPQYVADLKARSKYPEAYHERISLDIVTGQYRAAMQEAVTLLAAHPNDAAAVYEVCRVFKAADLNFKRANNFLNFYKTGEGDDMVEAFFEEPTPEGATPAPTAPKMTPELLAQLTAILNRAGQNGGQLRPINGALVTGPAFFDLLHLKRLDLDHAWISKSITADELLALLSFDTTPPLEEGYAWAGFLVTHAPERIQDPARIGAGPKWWIGNYYRIQHDVRAIPYFEPIAAANRSTFKELKPEPSWTVSGFNDAAERHFDWFYGEQKTVDPIAVPHALRIELPPAFKSAIPLYLRLIIYSKQPTLTATSPTTKVNLRQEENWRTHESWYYRHKDILVEVLPSALVPGFETTLQISDAAEKTTQVPLSVVEAGAPPLVKESQPVSTAPP